jgi:hypothetical protein
MLCIIISAYFGKRPPKPDLIPSVPTCFGLLFLIYFALSLSI